MQRGIGSKERGRKEREGGRVIPAPVQRAYFSTANSRRGVKRKGGRGGGGGWRER
jgi:hypothetical protein